MCGHGYRAIRWMIFFNVLLVVSLLITKAFLTEFPEQTENTRIFTQALPLPLFYELRHSLYDISRRFHKRSDYGTFWFPLSNQPTNVIEHTIVYISKELVQLEGQWQGAEW